jgi:hypothetical protein
MRKRYREEELSRILGEHAAGTLLPGGAGGWRKVELSFGADDTVLAIVREPACCVNQAAFNEPSAALAWQRNEPAALWFDGGTDGKGYTPDMSLEALLRALEASR